jgi:hypothetical protein
MAPRQTKLDIQKVGRQLSVPKDQGKPFIYVIVYFD